MNKPEPEQIEQALVAAERMREHGVDPHHLAHVLLYLHQRNQRLEEVLRRTDRYLRFGLAEADLARLRRLVQSLREDAERETPFESDTSLLL